MSWEFYTSAGVKKVATEGGGSVGDADTLDGFDSLAFVKRSGDSMTGLLSLSGAPVSNTDAATKLYVDTTAAAAAAGVTGFVSDTGDTMTGSLTMSGAGVQVVLPNAPTSGTHAANKTYIDTTALLLTGGTLTGNLTLSASSNIVLDNASGLQWSDVSLVRGAIGGFLELSLGDQLRVQQDPIHANDVARKSYVDAVASGVLDLDDISDVDVPTPFIGDVLTWDGAFWSAYAPQPALDTVFAVTTATYSAGAGYNTLLVDTSTTSVDITLPDSGSAAVGTKFIIKDSAGNASANNITLESVALETIDGLTNYVLDTDYEWVVVIYDGTAWSVVG